MGGFFGACSVLKTDSGDSVTAKVTGHLLGSGKAGWSGPTDGTVGIFAAQDKFGRLLEDSFGGCYSSKLVR